MSDPKFEIKKSKDGQFYFVLIAVNGEPILVSEMYISKQSCLNGIAAVKRDAPKAEIEDLT